jgi:hypothetical protein
MSESKERMTGGSKVYTRSIDGVNNPYGLLDGTGNLHGSLHDAKTRDA